MLTDDIFGVKYVLSKYQVLTPYTDTVETENTLGVAVYENKDVFPLAYLADGELIGGELDGESPFSAQESLAALISGEEEQIYASITDTVFNCENINIGSTTDSHMSYKKRIESNDASISYTVTMPHGGKAYMYLPTDYERKCQLYVDGGYIKDYFENENHSIAYLGTYETGDSFTVELKLQKDAIYIKDTLFFYLDEEKLDAFNSKVWSINTETSVTRTSGSSLNIEVNAAEDCALFTSIPFEEGWTAYIDGVETDIRSTADATLMCLEVPEGKHTIELKFFPAGLKPGLFITGSGVLLLVIMVLAAKFGVYDRFKDEDEPIDGEYPTEEENG